MKFPSVILVLFVLVSFISSTYAGCSTQPTIKWANKYYGWGMKWGYVTVTAPANSNAVDYNDPSGGYTDADWYGIGNRPTSDGRYATDYYISRPDDGANLPLKFQVNVACGDGTFNPVIISSDTNFVFCFYSPGCGTGL